MPTLTRRSMDAYRRNLDAIEERAVKGFSAAVGKAAVGFMDANDESTRSVYRHYIADEVYGRMDTATAQCQALADDIFEAIVGLDPSPHDAYPYDGAYARVKSAAVHLFKGKDPDEFVRVLESFIRQEVRGAASRATAENVEEANRL